VKPAAQWVALLSRCLFVVASTREAALRQPQEALPPPGGSEKADNAFTQEDFLSLHKEIIDWCEWCVAALPCYLNAVGLPADVLLQLKEQQAAVLALLGNLSDDAAAAADCSTVQQLLADMHEVSLLQKLCKFAQAVAGRIPLSTACNNPGCVSLAQRSELLLVGGKSCVCGRCKAAR
jgi:hypothetical protein